MTLCLDKNNYFYKLLYYPRVNRLETYIYMDIIRLPKIYLFDNRNNYALKLIISYIKQHLPIEYYKYICNIVGVKFFKYISGYPKHMLNVLIPHSVEVNPIMVNNWEIYGKIYKDPRGKKPKLQKYKNMKFIHIYSYYVQGWVLCLDESHIST